MTIRTPRLTGVIALSALLLGAIGTTRVLQDPSSTQAASPAPSPSTQAQPTDTDDGSIAPLLLNVEGLVDVSDIGRAVIPSVVTVEVGRTVDGDLIRTGSGSGVVYDATEGFVLTNDHVIAAGESYRVTLANGRIYEAELIGSDPSTDVAVLDIDADDLTAIHLGTTRGLHVGQPAVAVGSPLALVGGPSLTVGVVSALGRQVRVNPDVTLFGMIQTDAPIVGGSSGGALVDAAGRLIGITTAIAVSDVGAEGIGFATPAEIVRRVADEIIATGEASQPLLGITGTTGFADLPDGGSAPTGVTVISVEPDTAAAAAGLQDGDLITAIGGISIDTMDELVAELRTYGAGDPVRLAVVRDGDERTVDLELGNR